MSMFDSRDPFQYTPQAGLRVHREPQIAVGASALDPEKFQRSGQKRGSGFSACRGSSSIAARKRRSTSSRSSSAALSSCAQELFLMADEGLVQNNQEPNEQPPPRREGQEPEGNVRPVPPLNEARNPFRMQCPNYGAFEWDDERQRLVNDGTVVDEDQAVVHLVAQWQQKIERAKEDWLRRGGAAPNPGGEGENRGENARANVRNSSRASSPTMPSVRGGGDAPPPSDFIFKKKYVPIREGKMGPDTFLDPPSQFAQNKIRKWEYIELSYFTAQEREKAKRQQLAFNDDVLSIERGSHSLTLTPAAQASKDARGDHELTWDEVMQARGPYMEWLEKLQWPRTYIEMHATFFWRLDTHELRSQKGGTDVLVRYQAKYRREWHLSLDNREPFDLSVINEEGLAKIRTEILREQLEASISSVSTINITSPEN
ncbi:hypothetical protein C8Q79DRAFT_925847 [Trametes meyenii]|nr:hypothetical protein C8Q79DRAFT_925847 [Trametes meyenii]